MESELDLFKERDSSGLAFWDIVRFDVFYTIYFTLTENTKPGEVQGNSSSKKKISSLNHIKNIFGFLKTIFFIKKDYLFFICSRYKDLNNSQYDISSFDLLERVGDNSIIFETYLNGSNYRHKGIINYGLLLSEILQRYKLIKIPKINDVDIEVYNKLIVKLNTIFGIKFDFTSLFKKLIKRYHFELYYYKKIFVIIKPKKIFVIQNGIQKSLFFAANQLSIPCYEIQHGLIGYIHPAYSYPNHIKQGEVNTLPKFFLTYSPFWTQNMNYPVKKVFSIGNSLLAEKKPKKSQTFDLTFILADIYTNVLLDLIIEIKILGYSGVICIKLHPNQSTQFQEIKDRISVYSNIIVVSNQSTVEELLLVSKAIVAIQSTVVYQALHNEIPVFLYKRLDFETHKDVFEDTFVEKFDSANELINISNNFDITKKREKEKISFFMPFNNEVVYLNQVKL
jgi:hypothetical protein